MEASFRFLSFQVACDSNAFSLNVYSTYLLCLTRDCAADVVIDISSSEDETMVAVLRSSYLKESSTCSDV